MAHIRQSTPESGLGFQVKVLDPFEVVPSSLGSSPQPLSARISQESSRTLGWTHMKMAVCNTFEREFDPFLQFE